MRPFLPALPLAAFVAAGLPGLAALAAENLAQGRVTSTDGKPLSGVFVQQRGGVTSAITDEQGRFSLRTEPSAQPILTFSAVGYLPADVALAHAGTVVLRAVPTYRPGFLLSVPPGAAARPDTEADLGQRFFETEVGVAYRARYESFTARSRQVAGWVNNEVAGSARLRLDALTLGLDGFRFKAPVQVGPLAAQPAPQPSAETTQWGAWLGYIYPLAGFEVLGQVGVATQYLVPSNSGTPWTGTPLDYSTTRQGVAIGLEAGRVVGPLDFSARAIAHPSLGVTVSGAPYAVPDLRSFEVGVGAGYEVLPGLRLGGSVGRQWGGGTDLDEWANVVALSLAYRPARVGP